MGRSAIEKPGFGLIGREEDGHAAVNGADELIGRAGEDGEGFQRENQRGGFAEEL